MEQKKTQQQVEREMQELNEKFNNFLHTKGFAAKFKVAFADMGESAHVQHQKDAAQFAEVKARSAEQNKDFVEFIHTKGIKAKCRLVIENIKRGANEAKSAAAPAQSAKVTREDRDLAHIAEQLNEILKAEGLDGEYKVVSCGSSQEATDEEIN